MGNSSIIYVTVNTDVQKKINRRIREYMKNVGQWDVYGCFKAASLLFIIRKKKKLV